MLFKQNLRPSLLYFCKVGEKIILSKFGGIEEGFFYISYCGLFPNPLIVLTTK